jgi:hypothetical protein
MRLDDRHQLELLLLRGVAAAATVLALASCGEGGDAPEPRFSDERAQVPCVSDEPEQGDVSFANPNVAIGRDPRKPKGGELPSDRFGGELPWFAKTALFIRGSREVVVRVPAELSDDVRIQGWGQGEGEPREAILVQATSGCPEKDWTAYPGGLTFRGRHCVRLQVEGPGDARGSVLLGLRRDCSRT